MNPPTLNSTIEDSPVEKETIANALGRRPFQPGRASARPAANHPAMHDRWDKLPAVVGFFWVLKIAATTLGETGGDLFAQTLKFGYGVTSVVMFSLLFMSLAAQMRTRSYKPWIYWSVILLTSTAGTTMSDFMNRTLKFGYAKGSAILIALLLATLATWRAVEGNLDVKHVRSRRAEIFYWTVILFSNTLGTSLGDYLADSSGLGFGGGALLVGSVMLAVLLAYRYTKLSRVGLFWVAFVLTRPLGATAGDLFTKTHAKGGLEFGTKGTSALLAAILAGCIMYASKQLKSRRELAAA